MEEIWKKLRVCEDYSVSSFGRIRRDEKRRKGKNGTYGLVKEKILKLNPNTRGYLQVCLSVDKERKTFLVHRLVVDTFITPIIGSTTLMTVDHINQVKTDNKLENLRYLPHRENCIHSTKRTNLPTGVYETGKRYAARIKRNGKSYAIGSYKTAESASKAYQREKKKMNDKAIRMHNSKVSVHCT